MLTLIFLFFPLVDYDIDSEDAIRETFTAFDKDGDGFICVDDFITVMRQMNKSITREEATKVIEAADENGDGLISYDEFIQILQATRGTTVN